ncbi:MAG: hypothetical protein ABI651_02010 [Verrucomicrobiota bacterium]
MRILRVTGNLSEAENGKSDAGAHSVEHHDSMCLACCERPAGSGMAVRRFGQWLLRSCVIALLSAGRMPAAR